MAVKMGLFWITLILSVFGLNAEGEFSVLYSPWSLKFSGSSKIQESLLKEVLSASLGLSVEENSEWNGLTISDPFNTPEAVVEVYIDGVTNLGPSANVKGTHFRLVVDEYEPDTYYAVKHRILQRSANRGNKLVNIRLSDIDDIASYSNVFGNIKPSPTKLTLEHLKYSVEEDYNFLTELQTLKTITERVQSGAVSADNVVDLYNFRFRSLHALSDYHGPNSLQTKEAKKLLGGALDELAKAFEKAYEGSVLVVAVTTDIAHTRRTARDARDAPDAPEAPAPPASPAATVSAEDNYSPDFAPMFNIILWFSLVFAFALIAIVYAIMDMDPGRDSIIYRMTSTRMKKDN